MQTSAKTKSKEFMKVLEKELPAEATEHLPFGLVQSLVSKLLLEHERDTRYTAIDIINSMDAEVVDDPNNSELNGQPCQLTVIDPEEVISQIHNLIVGS